MQFEFSTVSRIIFGVGKLNSLSELAVSLGKKAFIVSGAPKSISVLLEGQMDTMGIEWTQIKVSHEPTVELITEIIGTARHFSPNLVIGIGGGSAIDTAKAVAALLVNPGTVTDYLEVIGSNKPLNNLSIPVIAIPTTAGTGAEVTRNAVIGSPLQGVKTSLRGPTLLPRIALVDPELTIGVPPDITARTGMDALTQLIEPFVSNSSNPLTDALCREGIHRVAQSFFQAYDEGSNIAARTDMALASLFSGMALANAKLGAVHGLAGPLGGEIPAPHSAICATLLPIVMSENIHAIKDREPDHPVIERYTEIGRILCNDLSATAESGIEWIREFYTHAQIRSLSSYGLIEDRFTKIIDKALISSSMKGNPIRLNEKELRNILQRSL
jgi:alcohol dehydrogenase class IV